MSSDVSSLLLESAMLLLVGMSVVFVFLSMLIVVVMGISKFAAKYPEPEAVNKIPERKLKPQEHQGISPAVVSAITAAVHQHRKNR